MAATHRVSMSSIMSEQTIRVRIDGARRMKARIWLGCQLFRFAGWVIGCRVVIAMGDGAAVKLDACPEFDAKVSDHGWRRQAPVSVPAGVPRRASIYDKDFDHELGRRIEVYLDGKLQGMVVAYDVDAGTVTRHAPDADGRAQLDETREAVKIETATGRVEVRLTGD
jgi:hypothetical protein